MANVMSIDMNRVRVVIFLLLNLITASAFASADKYVASNNSEPYPALSGSSIILSGTTDDGNSSVYPIGFDFEFDQTTYNSFSASANGFIKLGNSGLSGANYTNNPDGRLIMHVETPQEKVSFYPNSKGVFIIRSIGSKFQYTRKLIVH